MSSRGKTRTDSQPVTNNHDGQEKEATMIEESRVNGFGWYLGAFALGATAGVAIALLTAPRSGRETRAQLKRAALDLQKSMENVTGAMQRTAARTVKAGQAAYERVREEAG